MRPPSGSTVGAQVPPRQRAASTNNDVQLMIAELEPYLVSIRRDYYVRNKGKLQNKRRVLIISDSQSTVRIGSGEYMASTNLDLWGCVRFWEEQGYVLDWQWLDRNTNPLSIWIDRWSKTGEIYAQMSDTGELYGLLPL